MLDELLELLRPVLCALDLAEHLEAAMRDQVERGVAMAMVMVMVIVMVMLMSMRMCMRMRMWM